MSKNLSRNKRSVFVSQKIEIQLKKLTLKAQSVWINKVNLAVQKYSKFIIQKTKSVIILNKFILINSAKI